MARKVSETNDDYETGLLADIEDKTSAGKEVKLDMQQQSDIEGTTEECEVKLDEIRTTFGPDMVRTKSTLQ